MYSDPLEPPRDVSEENCGYKKWPRLFSIFFFSDWHTNAFSCSHSGADGDSYITIITLGDIDFFLNLESVFLMKHT